MKSHCVFTLTSYITSFCIHIQILPFLIDVHIFILKTFKVKILFITTIFIWGYIKQKCNLLMARYVVDF